MEHDKGPLLGVPAAGSTTYDPELLFPVPRANARAILPGSRFDGHGEDLWHAYELSWLDADGMPQVYLGTVVVPATSPNLVESKSMKLYLNSLNNHRFKDHEEAVARISADLSAVAGAPVSVNLSAVNDSAFGPTDLEGTSLDDLRVVPPQAPDMGYLHPVPGDDRVYTHLMRSLCPVTAQPDWATVIIETRGYRAEREGLLAYLLAYREHQEFHEQCVERIFTDLSDALAPSFLSVQALYTRRGGLDICPWRCSEERPAPRWRTYRQ